MHPGCGRQDPLPADSATTTTTRRLAPEGPGATRSLAPWPTTSRADGETPWPSKKPATAAARAEERVLFQLALPVLEA